LAPLRLDACGITLAAGGRILLGDFSQTFRSGELWCVAGPNGAGKTTLLHTLAGLVAPRHGHVELDGRALGAWPSQQLARRRALLPQAARDAFSASVLETVLLGRHPYGTGWGWEDAGDHAHAWAALAAFGLEALAVRDVLTLSGGERRRVALAAAWCQGTSLLLLDEPLAHLDWHHQIDALDSMVDAVSRNNACIIFSCHDLNLARRFASHALLFDGAGSAYRGAAREVLCAELASRAFGYPMVLLAAGQHEALVPDLRRGQP
jgi:ABC-type cobalamin/Fe3+-siderophores transport system ATPase subunit